MYKFDVSRISKPTFAAMGWGVLVVTCCLGLTRAAGLEAGDTAGLEKRINRSCAIFRARTTILRAASRDGSRSFATGFRLTSTQISKPVVWRVFKAAFAAMGWGVLVVTCCLGLTRAAGLEAGDTAGLETCATFKVAGIFSDPRSPEMIQLFLFERAQQFHALRAGTARDREFDVFLMVFPFEGVFAIRTLNE